MDDKLTTKDAITVLRNLQDWLYLSGINGGTSIQREAIDIAIGALIQLKTGKWIEYEQEFMLEGSLKTAQKTVRECSVCTTKIAGMVGIMNYCPNCGADMRKVST